MKQRALRYGGENAEDENKEGKSRLSCVFRSGVAILIGCMPANSQVVYGAENRVTLTHGDRVEYGTHFTTKMYVDGDERNIAYCLEPGKWMPDEKELSLRAFGEWLGSA